VMLNSGTAPAYGGSRDPGCAEPPVSDKREQLAGRTTPAVALTLNALRNARFVLVNVNFLRIPEGVCPLRT
jgi:hypothetical protein